LGSETEYAAKFNKSPVLPVAQKQNILASTPENFKTVVQLVTEILNISGAKTDAGPKEFLLSC